MECCVILMEFRAILMECGAIFDIFCTTLMKCRAIIMECHALLMECCTIL